MPSRCQSAVGWTQFPSKVVARSPCSLSLVDGAGGLETSLWVITAFAIVGRIGLGLTLPSLNLGAIRRLPMVNISHGSSAINFLRQLGGAVGVSLAGIVLEWRLQVHATEPLRAFHQTFGLLAPLPLAIVAGWRMQPPGAGVVRRDAPASEHQPTDIT